MKPKEKAEELIDKFENYSFMDIDKKISSFNSAKQCALIAVDEIRNILSMPNIPKYYPIVTDEYWEQVKQEIEKL
jgi:hypothetical protein